MKQRDFRRLGRDAQEALRERGVYLVVHEGLTQGQAADAVGVHRQVVNRWIARHRQAGLAGLKDGRRESSRKGEGVLTAAEARRVQNWIRGRTPDQLKLPFALWTAQAVRELIEDKLGKQLGLSTMQLYLKRWGFTSQRPLTRAIQRDPQKIKTWLEKDYPRIAARAKREKAAIYWGDETGLSNQDQIGKGYAPKGQTPIVAQTAQKFSASMIAAVNNRGLMRFMIYDGALNARRFIEFMARLIKDASRKVFFIVDNLRVHKAKQVRAWLAAHKHMIEVFYLPPYAPECNPDEYLNNDLKQQMKNKPRPRDKNQLVAAAASTLRSIQKRPERVKSYFRAKHVRYAA
jgi:transposase